MTETINPDYDELNVLKARADLMEYSTEPIQTKTIECGFTPGIKEDMLVDDISAPKAAQKTGASYEEMMRAMGM